MPKSDISDLNIGNLALTGLNQEVCKDRKLIIDGPINHDERALPFMPTQQIQCTKSVIHFKIY